MAAVRERLDVDPERAWAGAVLAGVVALVGGVALFPRVVYDRFIWKYFWGPVYADAHGADCAWIANGGPVLGREMGGCPDAGATLARPGYTLVSEIGYAAVLLVALVGLAFLLRRLELERYRALFFALFPFMLFGGALRVVEDANDAAFSRGGEWLVAYPLNALFISPVIYFTVFGVALASLLLALYLDRRTGLVDGFEYPLAGMGTLAVLLALGTLVGMSTVTEYVHFFPVVLVVTLVLAGASTALTWVAIQRFVPQFNEGTGQMGLLVVLGQAVDGAANVIGIDWYTSLVPCVSPPDGVGCRNLVPKHPVNAAVKSMTGSIQPRWLTEAVGSVWPFLPLKLLAAVFIVWVFDEQVIEESPRFSVMLLIGAVAVGLGPGTRDMLRATFGV